MTHVSADDYHRYDRSRRRRARRHAAAPGLNHLDILTQHLIHLRRGEPVLKPVYSHRDGTFAPPVYVRPANFLVVEGLLNFHTETLRSVHDVRVVLAPPEELRRAWKLKRDCTRRGYTTDEVLAELDRRQRDSERFILPQREHADIVVAFRPERVGRPGASRRRRDPARHAAAPRPVAAARRRRHGGPDARSSASASGCSRIPGDLDPEHAAELEEAVWERMSFASHLRIRRLGEFTVGHRPAALGLARARAAPDPLPRRHAPGPRSRSAARHRGRSAPGPGSGFGPARLT